MEGLDNLEQSNRSKYGDKSNDLISQAYELGLNYGHTWTIFNVRKYIDRFIRPGSTKGNQLIDLIKARDYLNRAIEAVESHGYKLKNDGNTESKNQG